VEASSLSFLMVSSLSLEIKDQNYHLRDISNLSYELQCCLSCFFYREIAVGNYSLLKLFIVGLIHLSPD
jgi:hypothetical protein